MAEERTCFICGRPNPRNSRVCPTCAAVVELGGTPTAAGGGTALQLEQTDPTEAQIAEITRRRLGSVPLPPQLKEVQARQEATARLEAERQARFSEEESVRLAALKNARELDVQRETERQEPAEAAVLSCIRCGAEVPVEAPVKFSFCTVCGADLPAGARAATMNASAARASLPFGVRDTRATMRQIARLQRQAVPATVGQTAGQTCRAAERRDISPWLNACLSFFFPGVGQMMNGQMGKGLFLILVAFLSGIGTASPTGIVLLIGRIVVAIDAYRVAERRRRGENVRPNEWDLG